MNVSIIQHFKDTCPKTITIDEVVDMIRNDSWLPGYQPVLMVQGIFEGGVKKDSLKEMSGLAIVLFSHLDDNRMAEIREEAIDDPHTLLLFRSPDGLVIIYPYEIDSYYELDSQRKFYQKVLVYGNDYYESVLESPPIRKGKDAGKRCILCHDPDVYYNPQADEFYSMEILEATRPGTSKLKSKVGLRERKPNWQESMMNIDEIEDWLKHHIELRNNVITQRKEYRWLENNAVEGTGPWQNFDDHTLNSLYRRMKKEKPVKRDEIDWVIGSDFIKDFNPFRDYLDSLAPYDGSDYILGMAASVTVAGGMDEWVVFVECLRKWLVAMIAGWLENDVVNHVVLMFIGLQGIYKTTWMNHILPPQLRRYFCTQAGIGRTDKDSQLAMAQYGLICSEEIDTMNNREMNEMKRAITLSHIDVRPAYGRYTEHRPHIASFCGTGNNEKFLNDPTGTRRWLVFKVENIVSPHTLPFEYEGIYAQAYYLYRNGFQYWFSDNDVKAIDKRNDRFKVANLERQLLFRYFRTPNDTDKGEFVDVGTAMQMFPGNVVSKIHKETVDQAFIDLGFERVVCDGMPGYLAVRRMPEEINSLGRQMGTKIIREKEKDKPF